MRVVIVIPIYKPVPNDLEILSLKQCLKIFNKRKVVFIYPSKMNIEYYERFTSQSKEQASFISFSPSFFNSITGYNNLMMRASFYKKFLSYEFMLIYQLDAFIFYDSLDKWMNKNYDYIGSPWIDEKTNMFYGVGNGGFSLRKISKLYSILKSKASVKGLKQLYFDYKLNESSLITKILLFPYILLRVIGYKNRINYWKKVCGMNEDYFWTLYLDKLGIPLKKPEPIEAIQFSFEEKPKILFDLNKGKLPMGCHAWDKNEYESFWHKYIYE